MSVESRIYNFPDSVREKETAAPSAIIQYVLKCISKSLRAIQQYTMYRYGKVNIICLLRTTERLNRCYWEADNCLVSINVDAFSEELKRTLSNAVVQFKMLYIVSCQLS